MSKAIGRLVQVGIAKESVRGTSPGSATFYIPWAELDVDEKKRFALDEQTRGVIEDSVGQSIVSEWAEGTIKAPIGDKHFPLLLYGLFGTLSSGSVVDSAYIHTISVAQSAQHQSLSIYLDDPAGGQDYTHALAMITQIEIAYERDQFITYTANFMAKKGATATLSPSSTAENRFLPQHLTFKVATTQSGLTAASAIALKSANIKITQNVEADDVLGSVAPADFLNKQFSIEGTIEAIFQNESDFKTIFNAGSVRALRFDLTNPVLIGSSSTPYLILDLHSVVFTEMTKPYRLNDVVMQTLSFKAHYNTTDSKMMTLTARNATVSY
jgi:hypothetical protein